LYFTHNTVVKTIKTTSKITRTVTTMANVATETVFDADDVELSARKSQLIMKIIGDVTDTIAIINWTLNRFRQGTS
jgi:hypothetical protein